MGIPRKLLLEGIDRVGKDTLLERIQHRHGYFQVLHYSKPLRLECYVEDSGAPEYRYQYESFRTMFQLLRGAEPARIICNRTHLGESVYAPMYRGYSGEYIFELESEFEANRLSDTRLILLTEDFTSARHFYDDGLSLGSVEARREEQANLIAAFERSAISDKRLVSVTDRSSGHFRDSRSILDEALE